jgi:hypothetical protein
VHRFIKAVELVRTVKRQSSDIILKLEEDGGGHGRKEFRSSGVQEFRSSGVQEFRSSGVQEFRVAQIGKLQAAKRL